MSLLSRFVKFALNLRYDVSVEGEEVIKKYKDASILFLANHPATIDPVIVQTFLYPYVHLQPLAAEKFFKSSFLNFFLKKIGALPVPEFEDGSNEYKAYKVERLTSKIKQALTKKSKILLYPAGHLCESGYEKIGGASLAFDLRKEPKKLVGIAIDGLYGSMFSRYFESKTPSFTETLFKGIKIALLNAIFFLPKRKVTVRVFEIDDSLKAIDDKLEFNRRLETMLNEKIHHLPKLLSYGFVKAPQKKTKQERKEAPFDPKILEQVLIIIERVTKKKAKPIAHFSYDLGIDSLELAEILAMVEQKYHTRIDQIPQNAQELASFVGKTRTSINDVMTKLSSRKALPVKLEESSNLVEAFYKQARRSYFRRMGADLSLGQVSYKKACLIVELLSEHIKKMDAEFIGILLPSSVMAYLLMIATLKASKKPVMLNWTSGRVANDFAASLLNLKHIISSEKFLDRAYNIDLGKQFEIIELLEDIKKQIGVFEKLKALIKTAFPFQTKFNHIKKDDIACVLFTSGSEAMPKAVPLSHANIMANIESLLKTDLIGKNDRFLATLPPFHSFGCVVSGFLPIITGLDTVYLPDPTDAVAIAQGIGQFDATLFCTAPSFMKQILTYSENGELNSLRLVVVGAEKLSEATRSLFDQVCPSATLLEGYGITECSPVVTIQKNIMTQGVGIPLSGIELLIVDPQSLTPLPIGSVGEILVCGKNVFNGYLGIKKDPFVEIDHKKWYRTGDRGSLTAKHELILEGRFKRFIKISAEMISLSALETALEDYQPSSSKEAQARFAVISDETKEKLILVTIYPSVDLDDLNHFLRSKGLPKVAKISKIVTVPAIPQLATGKIDYRKLENEIV